MMVRTLLRIWTSYLGWLGLSALTGQSVYAWAGEEVLHRLAADEVDELRANASRVIEKDGLDKDRILDELRQAMRQVRGGAA